MGAQHAYGETSMLSQQDHLLVMNKLAKRIRKTFPQKILIGDIPVNDQEYECLIEYLRVKCQYILRTGKLILDDPVFAVALVQIGIRHYDGSFWNHVARELGMKTINAQQQNRIGESFTSILQYYNKVMVDKNERVVNILMHGFVSDQYAYDFFEFLFKYYNYDLERDLDRNTKDMMDSLMDIARRSTNKGRNYLLVRQTAHALTVNNRGGRIRIRRFLRLIDRAFWDQHTPANPTSRLTILFNKWVEESEEFKTQFRRYRASGGWGRGKKNFSSPYFHCHFHTTAFELKLPSQIIPLDEPKNVHWTIRIGDRPPITINADMFPTIIGMKTVEQMCSIRTEDLFEPYTIELHCEGERLRLFKLKKDCIRFFDKSGDFLWTDNNLPRGEVYAFTRPDDIPLSEGLVDSERTGGLLRSCFDFEVGDIVRLPDGQAISVGKKIEEGLLDRNRCPGAECIHMDEKIPIYSAPPGVLIKIPKNRSVGTSIAVNGKRFRLFDEEVISIDLHDRSGNTGYMFNLGKYGCSEDGIYELIIDVPNERKERRWPFALIRGFQHEFEDAPYLFQKRGTIRFPEHLSIEPAESDMRKNSDANSFNFEISPELGQIRFAITSNPSIKLSFEVPVLRWRFGDGDWQVEKPEDLWHSELPHYLYVNFPSDRVSFWMDEEDTDQVDGREYKIGFRKMKEVHLFEGDMTRVRSWLGGERVLRRGYLELGNRSIEFLRIITRSMAASCLLKGLFQEGRIEGELNITGKSRYCVDVVKADTNETLAEKLPLADGKFSIPYDAGSGKYRVMVYEEEEDDSGFGLSDYRLIGTFEQQLTNPFDLRGRTLRIRSVKKGEESIFQLRLSKPYEIRNLAKYPGKGNRYKGELTVSQSKLPPVEVMVEFPDLGQLQYAYLLFFDGYDYVEFLYDSNQKLLVESEIPGLSRAVRYRRYESLYPEDYVFVLEFKD